MRDMETIENADEKYEQRDANLWAVLLFGGGLVLLTVAAIVVMCVMFNAFAVREARRDAAPSPLAAERKSSAAPKLQINLPKEMAELRAIEERLLNNYEWINKEAGIARIPIRQPMALLAEKRGGWGSEKVGFVAFFTRNST